MLFQTQIGPTTNSDGALQNSRGGRAGEIIVAESNGRYYETTYRGQKFSACNTAAVTIGVLAATNVSYALYNPVGSGKNAVIIAARFATSSSVTAAGPVFFAYNAQTSTPLSPTALTIRSNLLTGNPAASVCQVYSAATLSATPIPVAPFFGATTVTVTNAVPVKDDVAGELIVAPGGVLSIQGNVAATAVGFIQLSWDEVPI